MKHTLLLGGRCGFCGKISVVRAHGIISTHTRAARFTQESRRAARQDRFCGAREAKVHFAPVQWLPYSYISKLDADER